MWRKKTALLGWVVGTVLAAGPPVMEKQDLFRAGEGGYEIYRIPGIVVTTKGTLLVFCEARKDSSKGDWGTTDIMLRRSADGGKTWSEQGLIANVRGPNKKNPVALAQKLSDADTMTYNNPVAIADPKTGVVHFLFCLEYMRAFYMSSGDDGKTFGEPVEVTSTFDEFRPEYDWRVIATGPGHGLRLRNGRLIVPVWLSTGTGGHAHRPSVIATVYSTDGGRTWRRGQVAIPNTPEWVFPSESMLVELEDGRVMLNARSESKPNRRLKTISPDGASGWSQPEFQEELPEPVCMASMIRLSWAKSGGRSRILFSNPDNLERADGKSTPGMGRDRKNVTVRVSYDDGKTWPVKKAVEPGYSGYSDLAVGNDGTIYLLYESAGPKADSFRPNALTLARFNLEWLTDAKDSITRGR